MARQCVYGVLFGALAIIGTEWGIPIDGAQVNCRDAAVLTAGLLFGAPAGIIAGVIGGLSIFMVKKMMDDVRYRYENGQNILTVKKLLEK